MTRALAALLFVAFSAHGRTEAPVAPLEFGAVHTNWRPAMATDGVRSLVVWADSRDRAVNAIYGARLDTGGTLLDPAGVRLIDGLGGPAIAYGDGRYLVVAGSLEYVLVDREASVVARGKLSVGGGAVQAVFNGRDFVVFWGHERINVSIVDRDGRATDPTPLVAQQHELQLHAAATNGSRIVAVYARGGELRGAVTTMTGAPLADVAIASGRYPGATASISDSFVVVWHRIEGGVAAARLDANGALTQGPVLVAERGYGPQLAGSQLLTLDGEGRLVRRTLTDDLVAGPPSTLVEPQPLHPGDFAATDTLVVTRLHDPGRRVPEEGLYAIVPGGPRLVSRAGVTQLQPKVATSDAGTVVAWREETGLAATLARRPGAPEHFTVATGRINSHAVAAQDGAQLIVWSSNDGIFARIGGATISLDSFGFTDVAAASDGRGFVVAWAMAGELHVNRLTTEGEVTDAATVRYDSVNGRPPFALACDDGECLIAWRNQTARWTCPRFACIVVDERVLAVRLDAALAQLDPEPRVLSEVTHVAGIAAAADRGAYAVSWADYARTYVRTFDGEDTVAVAGGNPAIARAADGWLVVREAGTELVALRLRDAGAPYELTLFRDGQVRTAPALAADGATTLAVYERTTRGEAAGGVPRIFLTPVEPPKSRSRAISR